MTFLGIDTASPTVSLAVGTARETLALETMPQTRSSRRLLPALDSLLTQRGLGIEELEGIVVVRGPGSFTGMRVGLATVLGLHQATGVRCATVSTLTALAASVEEPDTAVVAAIDALRDEWFVQSFLSGDPPEARSEPERLSTSQLAEQLATTEACLVGHRQEDLARRLEVSPRGVVGVGPLAPVLLRLAPHLAQWRWQDLTEPLYLRSPAVTLPRQRAKTP